MSTVQSILDNIQYRADVTADLYHLINLGIRTVARRLFEMRSDILRADLSVPIFAEITYTADTIAFEDTGPDTITDSADQFVAEGFGVGMAIYSDSTSNPGPYQVETVAVGALTLISTDAVTAEVAGSDIALTASHDYGFLPTDFWGLIDMPYLDTKTYPLNPLPGMATKLKYVNTTSEPRFFQLKGNRIYVTPATSGDYTIKGDYFQRPTAVTGLTDVLPFYELFDDAIGEIVMQHYKAGEEILGVDTIKVINYFNEVVDQVASAYGKHAPIQPGGIDWEQLMEGGTFR